MSADKRRLVLQALVANDENRSGAAAAVKNLANLSSG
jgi:hypothetical protein